MGRLALLHHFESDAGDHFDLLLERESEEDRRAVTFRLDHPLDFFSLAEFAGERIRDHRAVYLDYEGPVPAPSPIGPQGRGGAGRVERVMTGRCTIHVETPDLLDLSLHDGTRHIRFIGERVSGAGHEGLGEWRFTRG